MLLMVDTRQLVIAGYRAGFEAEGVTLSGFTPDEFLVWIETAPAHELAAIEGFLLGDGEARLACARAIALRSSVATIAINDSSSLDATLSLFAEGLDDVVRKPVHVREILARLGAIRRRASHDAATAPARRPSQVRSRSISTAATPRSAASRSACRVASVASSNISSPTAAAA